MNNQPEIKNTRLHALLPLDGWLLDKRNKR